MYFTNNSKKTLVIEELDNGFLLTRNYPTIDKTIRMSFKNWKDILNNLQNIDLKIEETTEQIRDKDL